MINLLSDERKNQIRAARTNVILLRYTGIIVLAIVFLMSVLFVSHSVLQQTMATTEERIAINETRASVYSDTQQQVAALSAKLSEAKGLLDQEVSYATILTTLGKAMPQGTIVSSLAVNEATLNNGTPTEIIAYAKNDQAAALIQQNLQSSGIFSNVSLSGTDTKAGIDAYPIKVTLSVTFNRSSL